MDERIELQILKNRSHRPTESPWGEGQQFKSLLHIKVRKQVL